jgi:ankyrin repeat protein
MSGLSFFPNDNFEDDPTTDNYHKQQHQQRHHQHNTEMERLSNHLALRRLLYRMERYEDLSVLQDETVATSTSKGEEEKDENQNAGNNNNPHFQSWQSLLVRARLCQDLWQAVASENVDGGSDQELRNEYMELSQRVDAACKKAHVLADQEREREQKVSTGRDSDLVGRLFFSSKSDNDSGDEDDGEAKTAEREVATTEVQDGGESDNDDEYYDEFDDEESEAKTEDVPTNNKNNNKKHHRATAEDNLQELQNAQREQMEEAIAMMARRMKDATQGIQNTLQQQTAKTLNELETVAEQNMEDVTKVATNVKEHVAARKKSSWASWTTMILIVGVFAFALVTIFTVSKSPEASLGKRFSTSSKSGPYSRLVKKAMRGIRSVFDVNFFDSDDEEEECENEDVVRKDEEETGNYYDKHEDEATRMKKERLEELVRGMRPGGRKTQQQQQQQLEQQKQQELEQQKQKQQQQKQQELEQQLKEEETKSETEPDATKKDEHLSPNDFRDAAASNDYEAMKRYLEIAPGHINQQDKEGYTALHLAVNGKHSQIVRMLLQQYDDDADVENRENSINPDLKLYEGEWTALDIALENYGINDPITNIFFDTGWYDRSNFKHYEDEEKEEEEEHEIRNQRATEEEPNEKVYEQQQQQRQQISPKDFRVAAGSNDYETIKGYLEIIPEYINHQDKKGWTALHLAVNAKHVRIVRLLLEHDNIDPDVTLYKGGKTALNLALALYGTRNPVTDIFFDTGRYHRSDSEDYEDEEEERQDEEESEVEKETEEYDDDDEKYNDDDDDYGEEYEKERNVEDKIVEEEIPNLEENSKDEENNKAESKEENKKDSDNPWGIEPEEEIHEHQEHPSRSERRRNQGRDKGDDEIEDPKPPQEVNVDDIFASLQQQQASNENPFVEEEQADPAEAPSNNNFDPTNAFQREGMAAKYISPKDFRVAAGTDDYETLERYLEIAPEHINRQDKHGWTALHLAVSAKHSRIVRLLLDQYDRSYADKDLSHLNIDPNVASYEQEKTALDLALEYYGMNHPLTDAFFDSGWYDRSDYEDYVHHEELLIRKQRATEKEEKARLQKQKILEHEARVAKEREAIMIKEAKLAAAAEEERRLKKEKLDRLFGESAEELDDDEEEIEERRSRLDFLLGEL